MRTRSILAFAMSILLTGCPTGVRQGPVKESTSAAPEPHPIDGSSSPHTTPPTGRSPGGLEDGLAHYRWVQDRLNQSPDVSVVLAISGGGYRAAAFALGVLQQLENVSLSSAGATNLFNEVDYLTTVSGGGFAAASVTSYYLTTARRNISFSSYVPRSPVMRILSDNLEAHLLSAALRPVPPSPTRGDLLQDYMDQALFVGTTEYPIEVSSGTVSPAGTLSLSNVFVDKKDLETKPSSPYWLANAAIYNNGETLSFHPQALEDLKVTSYWEQGDRTSTGLSPSEFYGGIPLALGMRASMSFPVVFPPVQLKVNADGVGNGSGTKDIYLTDGGVSDNLALFSAMQILRFDRKQRVRSECQRQVLIIVDAFNGSTSRAGEGHIPWAGEALFDSLSNYHALAAHRQRTQSDLTNRDDNAFTVIEGAVRDGDVAVYYLDLDEELVARRTDTRLSAYGDTIPALVKAGRNQVCKKIGGSGCDQPYEGGGATFARTRKVRARAGQLLDIETESAQICKGAVDLRDRWTDDVWSVASLASRKYLSERIGQAKGKPIAFSREDLQPIVFLLERIAGDLDSLALEVKIELRKREEEVNERSTVLSADEGAEGEGALSTARSQEDVAMDKSIRNLSNGLKQARKIQKRIQNARAHVDSQVGREDYNDRAFWSRNQLRTAVEYSSQVAESVGPDEMSAKWRRWLVTDATLADFEAAWAQAANLRAEKQLAAQAADTAKAVEQFVAISEPEPSKECGSDFHRQLSDGIDTCRATQRSASRMATKPPPADDREFEADGNRLRQFRVRVQTLCSQLESIPGAESMSCSWPGVEKFAPGESAEVRHRVVGNLGKLAAKCRRLSDTVSRAAASLPNPVKREPVHNVAEWFQPLDECQQRRAPDRS